MTVMRPTTKSIIWTMLVIVFASAIVVGESECTSRSVRLPPGTDTRMEAPPRPPAVEPSAFRSDDDRGVARP